MFKMVFLQFLYDLSDRDIEEQCTWNMLFKCFLGLRTEELPPDHSTLCRFRLRLRAEGFQWLLGPPDEAEAMGRHGKEAVRHRYNWDCEEDKPLALYEKLVS